MKNNLNIAALIIIFILSFGAWEFYNLWQKERSDKIDQKALYNVELGVIKSWRSKDSLNHSQSEIARISERKIFEQSVNDNQEALKILSIKLNKLQGFRIGGSETEYHFKTFLRDSTIRDTVMVKVGEYKDKGGFVSFKEIIEGNEAKIDIITLDTLVSGFSKGRREKKKVLFLNLRIGRRPYIVEHVNKNPYSKITYSKEIYLKDQ